MSYGFRTLEQGQWAALWIGEASGGRPIEVYRTYDLLIEAPNWTADGSEIIVAGEGDLWRMDAGSFDVFARIHVTGAAPFNNDHVVGPDGLTMFGSAKDGNIYSAPVNGGSATCLTAQSSAEGLRHYLHGVSPDGRRLSFIGLRLRPEGGVAEANVFTMSADGGDLQQVTFGAALADGCEYDPSGEWLYFNTEVFDGHAQIARIRPDGSGLEQLTCDERVNWFPHLIVNGLALYLSYPEGTEGHPADRAVELKLVNGDWATPQTVAAFNGGQGTINVNSWSPDGSRYAFVSYGRD
ncbi:TolB family protein [Lysinibacter cavernae]|uniref:Tol biopolymer transport system component n=1 Tax=Lysinibacter cavernae TaxID=1640652 RepID=A0A7X5R160_9MICO|nr:biopolymer transporter Tol [Lysinibacter cavernae]NIH53733.1 Tol biopolymer transport system component [Lysinibacter cavernae]